MFFSAGETALPFLGESRLKRLGDEGDRRAAALSALKERQSDVSLWCGVCASLCMIAAAVLGTYVYSRPLGKALSSLMEGSAAAGPLAAVICFVLSGFLVLTFGQELPRRLVRYNPERFALSAIGPGRVLSFLFRPLTFPGRGIAKLLVRLLGFDPKQASPDITEEEIRMLLDAGNESGAIGLSEREMINNVFEFDDRPVGEVMTHRTDISAVPRDGTLSDVLDIARQKGFSRIPVYEGSLDDIVGIVYAKDLLELIDEPQKAGKGIEDYMRSVIYVPESTRCRMLFRRFKETKVHVAVIVDEYGGTAGIATMEDLLESIVGNIQDEYDQETDEVERLAENLWSFAGGVSLDKVETLLDVDLNADEDEDTLGGFIANTLGRIPKDGEMPSLTVENVEFCVLKVEERRILRVTARKLAVQKEEAE